MLRKWRWRNRVLPIDKMKCLLNDFRLIICHLNFAGVTGWLCVRFFVAFFSCFGPNCCCCFFDFSFRHRTKNRYHTKLVCLSPAFPFISSILSVYLFMFLLHVFSSVHCLGQHMITEISFSPPPPSLSLSFSLWFDLFSIKSFEIFNRPL